MPYTVSDLISSRNLTVELVNLTLTAAGLPLEQAEYSDEDIHHKFDVIRGLFDDQQVTDYESASELFASISNSSPLPKKTRSSKAKQEGKSQNGSTASPTQSVEELGNSSPSEETLDFTDLLASAKEQLGIRIKLTEGVQVLSTCGLPDKELYTQSECDRFIGACAALSQNGRVNIEDSIADTVSASESGLAGMADRITLERAQSLPGLVNQLYMKNAAQALNNSQEDIQGYWDEMGGRISAKIEGKSIIPQLLGRDWNQDSLNASSNKQMRLANASETTTNTELPNNSKFTEEK